MDLPPPSPQARRRDPERFSAGFEKYFQRTIIRCHRSSGRFLLRIILLLLTSSALSCPSSEPEERALLFTTKRWMTCTALTAPATLHTLFVRRMERSSEAEV